MKRKEEETKISKPLIIANPIYDTAFKRLMENQRIAKFFLSTILKQPITTIEVLPQEFTYKLDNPPEDEKEKNILYSVFRIDFMATILTEDGKYKKVLIEVQKSLGTIDVNRFRQYLGNQYLKKDTVVIDNRNQQMVLPITTIYILGSKLSEITCSCMRVGRTYTDMMTEEPVDGKSDVVEKLTHDSYFIQAGRIKDNRYSTRLEKLLSIFEQSYFVEPGSEITKEYRYQPEPEDEEIKLMTNILHEMGVDPVERKRIAAEEEAIRTIYDTFGVQLVEKDKIIEEKEKIIEEKDKTIEEKDKELEELRAKLAEMERHSPNKQTE
jgi:hypothetical protein